MQYSSSADRQDSPQRGFYVLLLPICSAATPPCLSAYRQIRVCQTVLTIEIRSEGSLLADPPTRSKSKCTIKNAHLTISSRLPNAYASYLRDQEKWYCKRYRISFITYTIQILSTPPCWRADWTLGKCETGLVERHPSGCCLDSHLHTQTDSLHFPLNGKSVQTSSVRVKKHDATQKVHCRSPDLSTGSAINTGWNIL